MIEEETRAIVQSGSFLGAKKHACDMSIWGGMDGLQDSFLLFFFRIPFCIDFRTYNTSLSAKTTVA